MKKFTFFTKDGEMIILEGMSAFNCLTSRDCPKDLRSKLSFYEEGICNDYVFDNTTNMWANTGGLNQYA